MDTLGAMVEAYRVYRDEEGFQSEARERFRDEVYTELRRWRDTLQFMWETGSQSADNRQEKVRQEMARRLLGMVQVVRVADIVFYRAKYLMLPSLPDEDQEIEHEQRST